MAVVTITTANWNDPSFWAAIVLSGAGHTLDFSGLPASYAVSFDTDTGAVTISDGATSFIIGDSAYGGTPDASLGGTTSWHGFTTLALGDGSHYVAASYNGDVVTSGSGDDTIYANSGINTVDAGDGDNVVYGGEADDSLSAGTGQDELYGGAGADTLSSGDGDDYIDGGSGGDLIYGGAGRDQIDGGWTADGADTIYAGDGNDLVFAGAGDDLVYGEADADWIAGGDGNDSIDGGTGDDRIIGQNDDDTIDGGTGDDTLTGGAGADSLIGGDGQDLIWGAAGDTVDGGEGGTDNDTLYVNDVASISWATAESGTVYFNAGGSLTFTNIETVDTNSGDGIVQGTSGDDGIGSFYFDADGDWVNNDDALGGGDADLILAGDGNDTVWAGEGADTVYGDAGADFLVGGGENDTVYGGIGDDTIEGGTGNDLLEGNDGQDVFVYATGSGADTVLGGEGGTDVDTLSFTGSSDGWTIDYTGAEAGTFYDTGATSSHVFSEIEALELSDHDDTVNGTLETAGFRADGLAGDDVVYGGTGADTVLGGEGADTLFGSAGNDSLEGGAGGDTLYGGADDDTLTGGAGQDYLYGDAGADVLVGNATGAGDFTLMTGGAGADTLDGSTGRWDVASYYTSPGAVNVDLTDAAPETGGDAEGDVLIGIEQLDGSVAGDDTLVGDAGVHEIKGWGGDDGLTLTAADGGVVYGGDGADTIIGGAGDDTLDGDDALATGGADLIYAGDGNDELIGDAGADTLHGEAGADTLYGGDGGDLLDGGTGADLVYGQDGDDTIVVSDGFGNDTVIGGETGETNGDTLDFSALSIPLTVSYNGAETGTATDGASTLSFSDVENLVLTDGADNVDARLDTAGLTIDGLGGDDHIRAGTGDDLIDGGDGSDRVHLYSNFGNDTIAGGEGGTDSDSLDADQVAGDITLVLTGEESGTLSAGGDTATFTEFEMFETGAGDDYIDLWANTTGVNIASEFGADTIISGQGDDVIGIGPAAYDGDVDTVVLQDGSGHDTITFFEAPTDNGDGTFTGLDQLDTTGLTSDGSTPVTIFDVTLSDTVGDGTGDAILSFPGGESVTLVGVLPAQLDSLNALAALGIPDPRDFAVEGTAAGDLITGSYAGDPDGDRIDAADNLAGDDDDLVYGYAGDDIIDAGAGDDLVYGGDDDDQLIGSAGADTLDGGAGNDTLYSGTGDDSILAGDGDDVIFASTGADHVDAGAGNDDIRFTDADTVLGGDGDDLFRADGLVLDGSPVSITGGEGVETAGDTLSSGTYAGDVSVDFTAGGTAADSESGEMQLGATTVSFTEIEQLSTGAGNDTVLGADGRENVSLGAGDDIYDGGAGDDWVRGDAGADTLTGGDGNDIFVYAAGDGADTITDFNTGNTGTLTDGDPTNNDFLDLSAFYDDIWELHADQADDGVLNQSNDGVGGVDYADNTRFQPGDSLTFTGASADGSSFTTENTGVACFTPGTMILTPEGEVPVETLRAGDRVVTRDRGVKPLAWVARRSLGAAALMAHPELRPVVIRKGAVGNRRRMRVSPQHGMMIETDAGQRLVRARHIAELLGGQFARVDRKCFHVTYIHLMFDRHELVFAEGAPSESFYPGRRALSGTEAAARAELFALFPELLDILRHDAAPTRAYGPPALGYLTRRAARPALAALRAAQTAR